MKLCITGMGGFVGTYLAQLCREQGHEVWGLDMHAGEGIHQADILDAKKVKEVLAGAEWIVHLAAQSSVKNSIADPEGTRNINVEGTRNVLEGASDKARILVVSSSDVYGTCKHPATEETPLHPLTPYGKSRVEQEELARTFGKDVIISRSFIHTGPRQKPLFVCPDFAKQIVEIERGLRTTVHTGNLDIVRDFSDVRDVARAYLLMLEKGKSTTYNVCSEKAVSLRDVLSLLSHMSTSSIHSEEQKNRVRESDVMYSLGNHQKLTHDTGWKPKIPLEQTLKELLMYWREHIPSSK